MYLIVGLGNPEKEYGNTRHNMGFDTINEIAKNNNIDINKNKFKGLYETLNLQNQKVILLKPQTYMNLSGESVREMVDFYNIEPQNIIVIYDDLDMEVGKIRLRAKGSAGGHNGIKSIINHIGTQTFYRIKIGIGRPKQGMSVVHHVLGKFDKDDYITILQTIDRVEEAVNDYLIEENFERSMQKYNG